LPIIGSEHGPSSQTECTFSPSRGDAPHECARAVSEIPNERAATARSSQPEDITVRPVPVESVAGWFEYLVGGIGPDQYEKSVRLVGPLRSALGLPISPTLEQLCALAKLLDPLTGERLLPRSQLSGWEHHWGGPKTVSVVWAHGEDRFATAFASAAFATGGVFAQLVKPHSSRAGVNENLLSTLTTTEGPQGVCLVVLHFDSRADEPQIHAHFFLFNLCQNSSGRWSTADVSAVGPLHSFLSQYLYARLHCELSQLGVRQEISPGSPGKWRVWEVLGISRALALRFSSRHNVIKAYQSISGKVGKLDAIVTRLKKIGVPNATIGNLFRARISEAENAAICAIRASFANAIEPAQAAHAFAESPQRITDILQKSLANDPGGARNIHVWVRRVLDDHFDLGCGIWLPKSHQNCARIILEGIRVPTTAGAGGISRHGTHVIEWPRHDSQRSSEIRFRREIQRAISSLSPVILSGSLPEDLQRSVSGRIEDLWQLCADSNQTRGFDAIVSLSQDVPLRLIERLQRRTIRLILVLSSNAADESALCAWLRASAPHVYSANPDLRRPIEATCRVDRWSSPRAFLASLSGAHQNRHELLTCFAQALEWDKNPVLVGESCDHAETMLRFVGSPSGTGAEEIVWQKLSRELWPPAPFHAIADRCVAGLGAAVQGRRVVVANYNDREAMVEWEGRACTLPRSCLQWLVPLNRRSVPLIKGLSLCADHNQSAIAPAGLRLSKGNGYVISNWDPEYLTFSKGIRIRRGSFLGTCTNAIGPSQNPDGDQIFLAFSPAFLRKQGGLSFIREYLKQTTGELHLLAPDIDETLSALNQDIPISNERPTAAKTLTQNDPEIAF